VFKVWLFTIEKEEKIQELEAQLKIEHEKVLMVCIHALNHDSFDNSSYSINFSIFRFLTPPK